MLAWLLRAYRRWRDRPVLEAHRAPKQAWARIGDSKPILVTVSFIPSDDVYVCAASNEDALPPGDGINVAPVDHYTQAIKATDAALRDALMQHSRAQQAEADAARNMREVDVLFTEAKDAKRP